MQRRGDEQGQTDTGDCRTHGVLGFYRIRDHAGQRAVIADRAGHDDVGTMPDAGCHNSGFNDSRPDRCLDAADGPDPVDGPQMVFMSMRYDATCRMPIAEGRSVEIDFHIMSGQRVPAEQDMDEFFFDEPCQRLTPSGVNNRRASCQQYFATRFPLSEPCSQLHEALGDVVDNIPVRTLSRDLRFHEAEHIAVAGPLQWDHPHAFTPAFARVIEKVTNAQSVKFLLKQKIGPQPVLLSKMYIQGRRIRIDIVGAEGMQQGAEQLQKEMERRNLTALFSQIGDFAAKEVLELDHFNKTYVRKALNEQVVAEFTKSNLIEQFRNIKYQDAQKLREETQDGRKIDVYLVKHVELMGMREDLSGQEGERMTVWIDRQSSLPIRILLEASTEVNGQSKDWLDFSEFSWNEPIGEDILSLQAPENYQAAKPQDITGKSD